MIMTRAVKYSAIISTAMHNVTLYANIDLIYASGISLTLGMSGSVGASAIRLFIRCHENVMRSV